MKELYTTGTIAFENGRKDPPNLPGAKKNGLYQLILGEGQNIFVGCGLGGTSLLNANVFLEADDKTLQMDLWPEEIRKDPESLKKCEYHIPNEGGVMAPEGNIRPLILELPGREESLLLSHNQYFQ